MSNTQFYTVNVSMKVPGTLSDVSEHIEFFKKLGGAECLEKIEIQRTIGSAQGDTIDDSFCMTHGRTVYFKFKVPFALDAESVFRGYHVTPINAVSKYFDEFTQCVKFNQYVTNSGAYQLVETADPVVSAAIIKNTFYDINDKSYTGFWEVSCRNKWGKDKTIE